MPEPSARKTRGCRAALTSAWQTVCRSRCHTLPLPGATGASPTTTPTPPPRGPAPPRVPHTSGWTLAPSWGKTSPESKGALQRPEKLTAGVTPPQDGGSAGNLANGAAAQRIPGPSRHPGHRSHGRPHAAGSASCHHVCHHRPWLSRRHRRWDLDKPAAPHSQPAELMPCKPPALQSTAQRQPGSAAARTWHGTTRHDTAQGQRCRRCLSGGRSRPDPAWFPAGRREWLAPVSFGLIKIHSA